MRPRAALKLPNHRSGTGSGSEPGLSDQKKRAVETALFGDVDVSQIKLMVSF